MMKEKLQNVESFFKNQRALFDEAVKYENDLRVDLEHIAKDADAKRALDAIRTITLIPNSGNFNYGRLPELNGLMATVHEKHDAMLEDKRHELLKIIDDCLNEIRAKAKDDAKSKSILSDEEDYFAHKKDYIGKLQVITLMDGQIPSIWLRKDDAIAKMDELAKKEENQPDVVRETPPTEPLKTKKNIKPVYRLSMFPKRVVETDADIDAYLEHIRKRMKTMLKDCDGIQLD